jgi:hypothetical protein
MRIHLRPMPLRHTATPLHIRICRVFSCSGCSRVPPVRYWNGQAVHQCESRSVWTQATPVMRAAAPSIPTPRSGPSQTPCFLSRWIRNAAGADESSVKAADHAPPCQQVSAQSSSGWLSGTVGWALAVGSQTSRTWRHRRKRRGNRFQRILLFIKRVAPLSRACLGKL